MKLTRGWGRDRGGRLSVETVAAQGHFHGSVVSGHQCSLPQRLEQLLLIRPGQVWVLDQIFGTFFVHVPIRATVMVVEGVSLSSLCKAQGMRNQACSCQGGCKAMHQDLHACASNCRAWQQPV